MSGVTKNSVLFEYSNNYKLTSLLPLVRKLPFKVCQEFGTCLVKKGKCMGVPFSWNIMLPSDPLSSRTLMTVLLGDIGQVSAYTRKLYELPLGTSKGLLHFVQYKGSTKVIRY